VKRVPIPLVGGMYTARSVIADGQECINIYPEQEQPTSKYPTILIRTPGLDKFTTLRGTNGVRALYVSSDNRLFYVRGTKFGEIHADKTSTEIGTIGSFQGHVGMADNGLCVVIADGKQGHIYNLKEWTSHVLTSGAYVDTVHRAGTFEAIVDAYYPMGSYVECKDGFFVVNAPDAVSFYISLLDDGWSWSDDTYPIGQTTNIVVGTVQVTSQGVTPEEISAIAKTNNELWMFTSRGVQVWYNSGAAEFPFAPISNAFMDIGTSAPESVVANGNTVFWIGSNLQGQNIVWMASGYSPSRISTHAIEYAISQMPETRDAVGYCYQQEGHFFYVLTFPQGDRTLVYDVTTGIWHERAWYNVVTGLYERHRSNCHVPWNNRNYVGDYEDGRVYALDLDTHTDDGDAIRWQRTLPHITNNMNRVSYYEFELDIEKGIGLNLAVDDNSAGVGTVTDAGRDPQVRLSWSNDGGKTYGPERWESMGKVGDFHIRMHWHRLGTARDRVFRVAGDAPVKTVLLAAFVGVEGEGSN
jgi:hypothetical protein